MKGKLSPQQELIVSTLRDMKWHCGREWVSQIKDDRARISNLNTFYMAQRGFTIQGEPCKGEICGKHKCPLYKRRAIKSTTHLPCASCLNNKNLIAQFDAA